MNPFVNPNKRGVSLPSGCKDLVEVLNRPKVAPRSMLRRYICLVLHQAQLDEAAELVIEPSSPSGEVPIRYKIKGSWYDMAPFPSSVRRRIVAELLQIAKLPARKAPAKGIVDMMFEDVRLTWMVEFTTAEGAVILTRIHV